MLVPTGWLQVCNVKRIICHWTAGGYKATASDRERYHILIEGDGTLVKGIYDIVDNMNTADGQYAAHTKGLNTGSVGVAVCCMWGAIRKPFQAGQFPMTLEQWNIMARAVADLCEFYNLPVTERTVLGHGEVERIYGIPQHGKWDPMRLPWKPALTEEQVGHAFRVLVRKKMER